MTFFFLLTCPLNLIIKIKKELNLLVILKPVALKYFLVPIMNEKVNNALSILNNPLVILNIFIINAHVMV